MEVRVRFRFNRVTGEVEVFDIIDEQTTEPLPIDEHNRTHDRIATSIAATIQPDARIDELEGPTEPPITEPIILEPPEPDPEPERRNQGQEHT